ncbi:MAG: hypothetical protein M1820_000619 [Bogoriella megaspora]|nr:MAG: hypothetical protein M1820_000619 [Bogoriella megaspora]
MAAASLLPVELIQIVYGFLDPRDFYSARQVSRWWYSSSNDVTVLRAQLKHLPIIQPSDPKKIRDFNWYRLMFDEVAHGQMMGMRLERSAQEITQYSNKTNKSKFAVSFDGSKLVALDRGLMTIYDTTKIDTTDKAAIKDYTTVHEQPTNSYRWMLGAGPWFKSAPNASFELGISEDKTVIAIVLERTIQIYKYGTLTTAPLSKWLAPACGDYVVGVEFAHNDRLLRLQLSKGHVIYLGQPSSHTSEDTFTYWQSAIHQVYLDSTTMQIRAPFGDANTVVQSHHLRIFPEAATASSNQIPFIIHPEGFAPFLYYTGFIRSTPDGSSESQITGVIPAQWCPFLPRIWFEGLTNAFPHVCTRETRTALSPDGKILAIWDPDFTTSAMPSGRVHLCRWPKEGSAEKIMSLVQKEDVDAGKMYHFPTLVGRLHGKVMDLRFDTTSKASGECGKSECYGLTVRTDEEFARWDVRLLGMPSWI